jgi:hypothetical protein
MLHQQGTFEIALDSDNSPKGSFAHVCVPKRVSFVATAHAADLLFACSFQAD